MPTSEDRVVQMRFENKDFEKNIAASQKSLELFEKTLAMNDGEKGLKQLNKALNDLDTTQAVTGLQNVTEKLSALETVATGALLNIGYKFENILSRGISSLSVDQIAAGWSKYADITSSTQTIMAATRSQFKDEAVQMAYVNEQLERLNTFTDETSYNLSDMTNSISKFTSQGVKLDTAVTAMQGIATWAGLSGATMDQFSRTMYNLSQALAVGSVKLIDWRSIENANMATVEFKEAVLSTAKAEGTLKEVSKGVYKTLKGNEVSIRNFNQALSDGWFTSDVLLKSLDKYGGFASKVTEYVSTFRAEGLNATKILSMVNSYLDGNLEENVDYDELKDDIADLDKIIKELASDEYELGRRAFEASQVTKTFAESLNAVKDAVSTGFMKMFQLIFGDYKEAKAFWTYVTEELYTIFVEPINEFNEVLKLWHQNYGYRDLLDGLKTLWYFLTSIKDSMVEAWKAVFPDLTAKDLIILTRRFKLWAQSLSENENVIKTLSAITSIFAKALKLLINIIKTLKFFFAPIIAQSKILIQNIGAFIRSISGGLQDLLGFENGIEALKIAFLLLGWAMSLPLKLINAFIDWLKKIGNKTLPEVLDDFSKFWQRVVASFEKFKGIFSGMGQNIVAGFSNGLMAGFGALLGVAGTIFTGLITFVKDILGIHSPSLVFMLIGGAIVAGLVLGLKKGGGSADIATALANLFSKVVNGLASAFSTIFTLFKSLGLVDLINSINGLLRSMDTFLNRVGVGINVFLKQKAKAAMFEALGKAIRNIILSIGAIIVLVIILSKLKPENLKMAVITFGAIVGLLVTMFGLLAVLSKVIGAKQNNVTKKISGGSSGFLAKLGLTFSNEAEYSTQLTDALNAFSKSLLIISVALSVLITVASKAVKTITEAGADIFDLAGIFIIFSALTIGFMLSAKKFNDKVTTKDVALLAGKLLIISGYLLGLSWALKLMAAIPALNTIKNIGHIFASLGLILAGTFGLKKLIDVLKINKQIVAITRAYIDILIFTGVLKLISEVLFTLKDIPLPTTGWNVIKLVLISGIIVAATAGLAKLVEVLNVNIFSILTVAAIASASVVMLWALSLLIDAINIVNVGDDTLKTLWNMVGIISVLSLVISLLGGLASGLTGGLGALGILAIGAAIIMIAFSIKIVSEALGVFSTNLITFVDALSYLSGNIGDVLLAGLALIALSAELTIAFTLLSLSSLQIIMVTGAILLFSLAIPRLISSCTLLAEAGDILTSTFEMIFNVISNVYVGILSLYPITPVLTKFGLALLSISLGFALLSAVSILLDKTKEHFSSFMDYINNLDFGTTIVGILKLMAILALLNIGLTVINPALLKFSAGVILLSLGITFLSLAFLLAKTIAEPLVNVLENFTEITGESIGKAFMFAAAALGIALAFAFIGIGAIALGGGLLVLGIGVAALAGGFALLALAGQLVLSLLDAMKERHEPLYNSVISFLSKLLEFGGAIMELGTTIVNFVMNIVSILSDLFSWLGNVFSNLWHGLVNGITSIFGGEGKKQIVAAADGIVDAVEDTYEIASPSHVMYEVGVDTGEGLVYGTADTIRNQSWRVVDAARKMAKDAKEAAEEEISDVDDEEVVGKTMRSKSILEEDIQNAIEPVVSKNKVDTLKELGSTLGNVFKDNWNDVKDGNITIGEGLKNIFTALKETGGEFLGNKIASLKDSLLGQGGILSGFSDLFGGKNFEDLFPGIDLDNLLPKIEDLTDAANNIDLDNFGVPDTSGLNGAAGGSQYSTSNYTFTQNNYSPKALSRIELYRQTSRQFNNFKVKESLAK